MPADVFIEKPAIKAGMSPGSYLSTGKAGIKGNSIVYISNKEREENRDTIISVLSFNMPPDKEGDTIEVSFLSKASIFGSICYILFFNRDA
jgi:hypothetical protein